MDTASHDVINDNQAVLSYLELIISDHQLDPKLLAYAQKAVSHVRASTIMVENLKRLGAALHTAKQDLVPFDLLPVAAKCASEIPVIFPGRNVRVKVSCKERSAFVLGNESVGDVIMNLLVNSIRLDPETAVALEVRLKETGEGAERKWMVEVEDRNALLPAGLELDDIQSLFSQDPSLRVKISGIMFAKLIAEGLGGDFEAGRLEPKGAAFRVCLRKANKA